MFLRFSRTTRTGHDAPGDWHDRHGDGWERTDSGIYLPDWADLDTRHADAVSPPLAIDLFAGAGGFSLGFKQAGWHVSAGDECDTDAAHACLCNLGSPHTRITAEVLSVVLCAVCAANYG